MIILGGTYSETTTFRASSALMGSGLRSALALASFQPKFITAVSEQEAPLLRSIVNAHDIHVYEGVRDQPVEFRYLDPLLRPEIEGHLATARFDITDDFDIDDVIAFGMVETMTLPPIRAKSLVLDPQSPRSASVDTLPVFEAERVALCANLKEVARLTGEVNPLSAAIAAMEQGSYSTVVVKCGALGYVVLEENIAYWEHAHPTETVRSLGSGDIFTACFSVAWFAGESPRAAARRAALETAAWACGQDDVLSSSALSQSSDLAAAVTPPIQPGYRPKVYLAGPFFELAERWLIDQLRSTLAGLGARVFSPIHEIGPGGTEVAKQDLDALEACDVVFAVLDGQDPGTIYEVGWAARAGIPTVGFTSEVHAKEHKMLVGMGAEIHTDLTTASYRALWVGQGVRPRAGIHLAAVATS